jgi:hypothetical protein
MNTPTQQDDGTTSHTWTQTVRNYDHRRSHDWLVVLAYIAILVLLAVLVMVSVAELQRQDDYIRIERPVATVAPELTT